MELEDLLQLIRSREERTRAELAEVLERQTAASGIASPLLSGDLRSPGDTFQTPAVSPSTATLTPNRPPLLEDSKQLHRLRQICAAAEQSVSTLNARLRASTAALSLSAQQEAEQESAAARSTASQHRNSVSQNSKAGGGGSGTIRRSSVAALRRGSVIPARRMSAADLTASRSLPAGTSRASLVVPKSHHQQHHPHDSSKGSIEAEELEKGDDISFCPGLMPLVIEAGQHLETLLRAVKAKQHRGTFKASKAAPDGRCLTPLEASSKERNGLGSSLDNEIKPADEDEAWTLAAVPAVAAASPNDSPNADGSPAREQVDNVVSCSRGYHRHTMAGPPWIESATTPLLASSSHTGEGNPGLHDKKKNHHHRASGEEVHGGSTQMHVEDALPTTTIAGKESPQEATQQAQQADRYMKRLVGAAVEPEPERFDPFALHEEADDCPVMDRAAIKHRSHKILSPKQPKLAGAQRGRVAG
jgi:hypothetical protein